MIATPSVYCPVSRLSKCGVHSTTLFGERAWKNGEVLLRAIILLYVLSLIGCSKAPAVLGVRETVHTSSLSPDGAYKTEVLNVDEGATGGWSTSVRAGFSANFEESKTPILQVQELRPIYTVWLSPKELVLEVLVGEDEAPEVNWQMTVFESVRIETRHILEWATEKSFDLSSRDGMYFASYNIVSSVRPDTEEWGSATFVSIKKRNEREPMPVLALRGRIEPELEWLGPGKLEVRLPEEVGDDFLMKWPCYGPGCEVRIAYRIEGKQNTE